MVTQLEKRIVERCREKEGKSAGSLFTSTARVSSPRRKPKVGMRKHADSQGASGSTSQVVKMMIHSRSIRRLNTVLPDRQKYPIAHRWVRMRSAAYYLARALRRYTRRREWSAKVTTVAGTAFFVRRLRELQQAKAHAVMRSTLWSVIIAGGMRCVAMQASLGYSKHQQVQVQQSPAALHQPKINSSKPIPESKVLKKVSELTLEKFRNAVAQYRASHGKDAKKRAMASFVADTGAEGSNHRGSNVFGGYGPGSTLARKSQHGVSQAVALELPPLKLDGNPYFRSLCILEGVGFYAASLQERRKKSLAQIVNASAPRASVGASLGAVGKDVRSRTSIAAKPSFMRPSVSIVPNAAQVGGAASSAASSNVQSPSASAKSLGQQSTVRSISVSVPGQKQSMSRQSTVEFRQSVQYFGGAGRKSLQLGSSKKPFVYRPRWSYTFFVDELAENWSAFGNLRTLANVIGVHGDDTIKSTLFATILVLQIF